MSDIRTDTFGNDMVEIEDGITTEDSRIVVNKCHSAIMKMNKPKVIQHFKSVLDDCYMELFKSTDVRVYKCTV